MIKFSIQQDKGGCAKTSLAVNLSYGLANKGLKVLLVDNDPQANATSNVLKVSKPLDIIAMNDIVEKFDKNCKSLGLDNLISAKQAIHSFVNKKVWDIEISDVYMNPQLIKQAIQKSDYDNLYVLPSSHRLSELDFQLKAAPFNRDTRLRDALDQIKYQYDIVIIDNSPFVNALTFNALNACYEEGDQVLIPITIDQFGLEGLDYTMQTLLDWISFAPYPIKYDLKIVIQMAKRTKNCRLGIEMIKQLFGNQVLDSVIRFQDKPIGSSFLQKKILLDAFPKTGIAEDYDKLVNEIYVNIVQGKEEI